MQVDIFYEIGLDICMFITNLYYIEDYKYVVTWNGKWYNCICTQRKGVMYYIKYIKYYEHYSSAINAFCS